MMGTHGSVTRLIIDLHSTILPFAKPRLAWSGGVISKSCWCWLGTTSPRESAVGKTRKTSCRACTSFCSRRRRGDFDLTNRDELWTLLVHIALRKARNTANRHLQQKREPFVGRTPRRRIDPVATRLARSSTISTRTARRPPRRPC